MSTRTLENISNVTKAVKFLLLLLFCLFFVVVVCLFLGWGGGRGASNELKRNHERLLLASECRFDAGLT